MIGHLTLELASLNISGDPDIKCCIYSALPGSEEEQKPGRLLSTLQEHVPTLK
ncbi:hypothetical protein [Thermosporothrix hazakensis]|uniref:hypothetical protein n=1 Tax=Thermosporothrix hazakensis TaxID=644383 RepID=UPI00353141C4